MGLVLALVDFSDVTGKVVDEAAAMARALGDRLVILHVAAPDPDFVGYEVGPQSVRDSMASHFHEEHQKLGVLEKGAAKAGGAVEALLVQGPTVEKALQMAERLCATHIVLGSHGHGALRKLLVGSVTEGVLRGAGCPVVVVPSHSG